MKEVEFHYKDALVSETELAKTLKVLRKEIEKMQLVCGMEYKDFRCSINLPNDKLMLKEVKTVVGKKLKLKPSCLVVVGIGGSNLGTIAIQEAVLGKISKVLYADTVDADSMNNIVKTVSLILKKGENVIVNVISKSGTTTETIANFEIILDILVKYRKDYQKYVVATTDKESKLYNLAFEKGFDVLEVPDVVGGRYSVFSPVGLFPLGILGVDIGRLLKGAFDMAYGRCLKFESNPAAISAVFHYINYKKGVNISDMFLFSNDLESLGKWNRQLMAESLGKKNEGITPTVSIGSTDLHSVGQLNLGGPYNKFTTFVSVKKNKHSLMVPKLGLNLVSSIEGQRLEFIMDAILKGTKNAYKKGKRPFMEIILPDKKEYSIGQFMQFKMIETIYLGYLMNVNPFDQPAVEKYKEETRKLLK